MRHNQLLIHPIADGSLDGIQTYGVQPQIASLLNHFPVSDCFVPRHRAIPSPMQHSRQVKRIPTPTWTRRTYIQQIDQLLEAASAQYPFVQAIVVTLFNSYAQSVKSISTIISPQPLRSLQTQYARYIESRLVSLSLQKVPPPDPVAQSAAQEASEVTNKASQESPGPDNRDLKVD